MGGISTIPERDITDGQPSHMPNSPLPLLLLSAPKLFHEAAFLHFVEIARVDHFLWLDRLGARLGGRDFIERRLDAFEFDRQARFERFDFDIVARLEQTA